MSKLIDLGAASLETKEEFFNTTNFDSAPKVLCDIPDVTVYYRLATSGTSTFNPDVHCIDPV